ncbi:hypothetical protein FF1_005532 [Malus domestica]
MDPANPSMAPPQPAAASHHVHSADPLLSFHRESPPCPGCMLITTPSRRGFSRLMWKFSLIWELMGGYTACTVADPTSGTNVRYATKYTTR